MARPKRKHWVYRDTRENKNGNGWWFPEGELCAGTIVQTIKTGDYTLEGYEDVFTIERKANTSEIAQNINEGRFGRELERLEEFKYPFLIAECTWDDVMNFPKGSGIPERIWPKLKVTNRFIVRRLMEYQLQYRTKIILAGSQAQNVAKSLFKRILEQV